MEFSDSYKRYQSERNDRAWECINGREKFEPNNPAEIEAFREEFKRISDLDPLPPIEISEGCMPCTDAAFTSIMQDPVLLEILIKSVTGKEIKVDESTIRAQYEYTQASVNEANPIRVDTHFNDIEGGIFSLDAQRTYVKKEERLRKRLWYYACRQFSSQKVEDMKYEDLKLSLVTFMMTDHEGDARSGIIHDCIYREYIHRAEDMKDGSSKTEVFEKVTDIINTYEIFAPLYVENPCGDENLMIFTSFFAIADKEAAEAFSRDYSLHPLARRLIRNYAVVTKNRELIARIDKEEFYMTKRGKDYYENKVKEARAEASAEARAEGKEEGIIEGKALGKAEFKAELKTKIDDCCANLMKKGISKEDLQSIQDIYNTFGGGNALPNA